MTLGDLLEVGGERSFGPILLLIGLITLSPVGDVPGVPTLMALVLVLVAGQLLLGRRRFRLPRWLKARSVAAKRVRTAVRWLAGPARFVDRLLKPRLTVLVSQRGTYAVAAVALLVAAAMPPMELVPFTATLAGLALTGLGLALVARDGLVALVAFAFTAAGLTAVATSLL